MKPHEENIGMFVFVTPSRFKKVILCWISPWSVKTLRGFLWYFTAYLHKSIGEAKNKKTKHTLL